MTAVNESSVKMYKTRIKAWGLTTYSKNGGGTLRCRAVAEKTRTKRGAERSSLVGTSYNTQLVIHATHPSPRFQETHLDMRPGYNQSYWPATQPHPVDVLVQRQIPRDRFVDQHEQFLRVAITGFQHGLDYASHLEIWDAPFTQESGRENCSDWDHSCLKSMKVQNRHLNITRGILECIVHSYCAVLKRNSMVAGIRWRHAFFLIDDALKIGLPDILMTLLGSAVLLIRCGCSEVVALLQAHLKRVVYMWADQHRPFARALTYFANSELRSLEWLKQCVVGLISETVPSARVRYDNHNHYENVYWSQESAQYYTFETVHEKFGLPPSKTALVDVAGYLIPEMPEAEARLNITEIWSAIPTNIISMRPIRPCLFPYSSNIPQSVSSNINRHKVAGMQTWDGTLSAIRR
jgi:hypothetical protein